MSGPSSTEIKGIANVAFQALCGETERREVPPEHAISTMIIAMAFMAGTYAATVSGIAGRSVEEIIDDITEGARCAADDAKELMREAARGTVQ